LNNHLKTLLRSHGKVAFVNRLPQGTVLLDVGCGSNSPARVKAQRPDIVYIGLDVRDYNHTVPPALHADRYIVVPPAGFAAEIEKLRGQCDAVISSHNLEHCLEPERVLSAITDALRPGGRLYLSFPAEESVNFPRRAGTLNFRDDPTHDRMPRYRHVLAVLEAHCMVIQFARKRYRPPLLFLAGLLLEPISALTKRTMPGLVTWALYGFESIIWAMRR
jgi:SAM-dependent methyltransferase